MNSYERFCFSLLKNRVAQKRAKYYDLIANLRSARMGLTFEVYYSTAIFTSVLIGITGSVLSGLLVYLLNVPGLIIFRGNIPVDIATRINEMAAYSLIVGTFIAIVVAFMVFYGGSMLVYMMYPTIVAGNRKRNIE